MFSSDQLDAIRHAQEILQQAGLQRTDILEVDSPVPIQTFPSLNYTSPHAVIFTPEELRQGKGRVTTRSQVQGLVDHPIGAVLEFPETGSDMGIAIGHRFRVSTPDFVNPKNNILYSLGGKRSIHRGVRCFLLLDKTTGDPVSRSFRQSLLIQDSCVQASFSIIATQCHWRIIHEDFGFLLRATRTRLFLC